MLRVLNLIMKQCLLWSVPTPGLPVVILILTCYDAVDGGVRELAAA